MNIKRLFLQVILFLICLTQLDAQSKAQFNTASKAAKGMSEAMKSMDKAQKATDAVAQMSKYAKFAKGFAAASVALEIGGALFGGEDENIRMLKEITKLVKEINYKLDKLQVQVRDGFENIENANEYRSAQNQVFKSISNINNATKKLNYYVNTNNDYTQREAKLDFLRIDVSEIGTDVENIMRSVEGAQGSLASNLLDASVIKSNADFPFVKGICTQLMAAITSAAFVESMYSQLKLDDKEMQDAARLRVSQKYNDIIDRLEKDITYILTHCGNFNTVNLYARKALDAANLKSYSSPQEHVDMLHKDLQESWIDTDIIIAAFKKRDNFIYPPSYMNNIFSKFNHPIIEIPWEKKNLDIQGIMWVVPKNLKKKGIPTDRSLNNLTPDQIDADARGMSYVVWDNKKHQFYANKQGFNTIAHFGIFQRSLRIGLTQLFDLDSNYVFFSSFSGSFRMISSLDNKWGSAKIFVYRQ